MPTPPIDSYFPIALILALAAGMGVVIPLLAGILGPKTSTSVKADTFEGGNVPMGSARQRFAVKFYVAALLFIVFDVEAVFLYPWAVNFKALGWFGYFTMVAFASTLVAGLVYIWKKGALSWES